MNIQKILSFSIGPLGSAVLAFVTIPIMASVFEPEDIGRFNFFQVILSFCLLFTVLGLDQAYVREFHESRDRAQLLKSCVSPGLILMLACLVPTVIYKAQLSQLLYDNPNPIFYWITIASVLAAFISRFLSLILRMEERGLAFSMSQLIPKALILIIFVAVVIFDIQRNFLILISAFFISSIAVIVIYLWNTRRQWIPAIGKKIDEQQMQSLLHYGIPLIFSGLAYWGLVAASSIILRSYSTFSELGIYSVTTSIAGVAVIFQSIFSVVWAPIVYKWTAEGVEVSRIDRLASQALFIVCAIFLSCGIFSWLVDYFLPTRYGIVKYLVLCAIVQPLLYTLSEITCVGIGITRRTMLAIWVTVLALCVNILLNLWLVPLHGASGAVVANSVAYLVFFIARTEASAFVWRKFPRLRLYLFTSLTVAFAIGTVIWGATLSFHYALLWLSLVPIVSWCFRNELADLIAACRTVWIRHTIIHVSK